MTATRALQRTRLDSPPRHPRPRTLGEALDTADTLTMIERLLIASQHPDINTVQRYGNDVQGGGQSPPGIAVTYQSGAKAFLWAAPDKTVAKPADLPTELPEYRFRAQHALKFLVDLLEVAKPARVTAWRTVAVDGVALSPCALEIRTERQSALIRVTSGGPPGPDADPTTFADYTIPEAGVLNATQ